jgi:uncharacterized RDD family membrane protein YckC
MSENILDTIVKEKEVSEYLYPGILERIKAAVTDSIVLIVLMIIIANVFSMFDSVTEGARIIAFVFVFGLYDPIFTSLFGGTIGHFIIGIRVVKDDDTRSKKILFPLAIIRYIVKILLGWISLLSINRSKKSKAMHDILINSLVIYKKK